MNLPIPMNTAARFWNDPLPDRCAFQSTLFCSPPVITTEPIRRMWWFKLNPVLLSVSEITRPPGWRSKALNLCFWAIRPLIKQTDSTVLDIGTGSGVLILTAVLGGMDGGMGIDIDSCARVEAAANVKINGLEDRIMISGQALETIDQRFSMVLANLRYPSLKKLFARLTEITDKRGVPSFCRA